MRTRGLSAGKINRIRTPRLPMSEPAASLYPPGGTSRDAAEYRGISSGNVVGSLGISSCEFTRKIQREDSVATREITAGMSTRITVGLGVSLGEGSHGNRTGGFLRHPKWDIISAGYRGITPGMSRGLSGSHAN